MVATLIVMASLIGAVIGIVAVDFKQRRGDADTRKAERDALQKMLHDFERSHNHLTQLVANAHERIGVMEAQKLTQRSTQAPGRAI